MLASKVRSFLCTWEKHSFDNVSPHAASIMLLLPRMKDLQAPAKVLLLLEGLPQARKPVRPCRSQLLDGLEKQSLERACVQLGVKLSRRENAQARDAEILAVSVMEHLPKILDEPMDVICGQGEQRGER